MSAPTWIVLGAVAVLAVLLVVCAVCPLPDREPRPEPDLERWIAQLPPIRAAELITRTSAPRPPSQAQPIQVIAADRAWCPAFLLDTDPTRPRHEVIDVDVV